jgi:hypothetical protein
MKFHPYAEIFPLIEGADFEALIADIKEHGLREAIWQLDGKILDGRNRFLACQKAKVTPKYRQFKGDDGAALAFVVSANVKRRHLNASQLSMAAGKIATLRDGQRADEVSGVSIETAAQIIGASVGSTKRARQVLDHGSKALQKAVESGEVSVSKAANVVELPKPEQLAAAKAKPEPVEKWEPEENEDAQLEQAEKEYTASIDKVMAADDKLAAAHVELKRQAAEIASLKLSRNGYQNQCSELIRRIKSLQRENDKLKRQAA